MRRLITVAITTLLGLIVLATPVFAAERFISTTISNPSTTSNLNLNIAFQVFSSLETDDQFAVQLFENNNLKASLEIVHPRGNSGIFSVTLPASGTYNYFVRSINHDNGDSAQDSSIVSVQITDAPQPIVTIVNTAPTTSTAGNQLTSTVAPKDIPANDLPAADLNKNNDNKKANNQKANNQGWGYTAGVILFLIAIAGGGYYFMVIRKAKKTKTKN